MIEGILIFTMCLYLIINNIFIGFIIFCHLVYLTNLKIYDQRITIYIPDYVGYTNYFKITHIMSLNVKLILGPTASDFGIECNQSN